MIYIQNQKKKKESKFKQVQNKTKQINLKKYKKDTKRGIGLLGVRSVSRESMLNCISHLLFI